MKVREGHDNPIHSRLSESATSVEEVLDERRERAFKWIISIAGTLSILSLLALCLVAPSAYNFIDNIGTFTRQDLAYCEVLTDLLYVLKLTLNWPTLFIFFKLCIRFIFLLSVFMKKDE